MRKYKLVPVEPTEAMIEAAAEAYMPFGDMDIALRMAILAAPAVQGEPVITPEMIEAGANQITLVDSAAECAVKAYRAMRAVAPQPAEQQPSPDVAALVEALELFVSNPIPTSEDFDKAYAALAAHRKGGEV